MRTNRIFRWAGLAALLATFAPAPASAQIGRFIKSRLKEKIAQVVVETVAMGDTTGGAPRGAPAEGALPSSGPVFTESMLEMSPALLMQFEKGLLAELAERQAIASLVPKTLSFGDWNKCAQKLKATPEGEKAYKATHSEYQLEREKAKANWDELKFATCGPYPGMAYKYRAQFADRQTQAILKASGLTERQYDILKERIIPFCTLGASTAGHSVPHVAQSGAFLVYSVKELMALGPYCPKLLLSLKALS